MAEPETLREGFQDEAPAAGRAVLLGASFLRAVSANQAIQGLDCLCHCDRFDPLFSPLTRGVGTQTSLGGGGLSELVRGFLLDPVPGPRSGLRLTLASARSREFGWVLCPELCSWAETRDWQVGGKHCECPGRADPSLCGLQLGVPWDRTWGTATSQLRVSPGLVLGTQDSEGKPESIPRFWQLLNVRREGFPSLWDCRPCLDRAESSASFSPGAASGCVVTREVPCLSGLWFPLGSGDGGPDPMPSWARVPGWDMVGANRQRLAWADGAGGPLEERAV